MNDNTKLSKTLQLPAELHQKHKWNLGKFESQERQTVTMMTTVVVTAAATAAAALQIVPFIGKEEMPRKEKCEWE